MNCCALSEKFPRATMWFAVCAVVTLLCASAPGDWTAYAQSGAASRGLGSTPAAKQAEKQPAKKAAKGKKDEKPAEAPPAATAPAGPNYSEVMKDLRFRSIGPAVMGGRIDDFAVVESNPSIVYVGTASGGILKTVNGGTTWEPIFDNEEVSTIGDLAIAPSSPDTIWAGTGEPNNRQSSSWGNGVYKSTDAGKTWQHMGLRATESIGRIVIHPANPNIVYVAAVGKLWGPSKERGVYKTTDGGRTWTNILYINEDTGVIDIVIDSASPDTLLAGAYQRRRTVFGFNGSGPHGGIHKTTDGGATWKKLVVGLPWDPNFRPGQMGPGAAPDPFMAAIAAQFGIQMTPPAQPAAQADAGKPQEIGRIGLNFYRGNTSIVYALVEHRNGGTFRSDDKGETWVRMSDVNPRAMYYSQIHVDPNNDQRVWALGASMFNSEDGGRSYVSNRVQRIHGDYHALWINPANSNHVMAGSDGGIHWSWDGGRTWDAVMTYPLGQFYEIGVDMRKPYYICGGLQDNNTWCGPSASMDIAGIRNADWYTTGGGDGFYAQMDPTDPNIVYAESQDGNVLRRDLRTHESKSIRPQEGEGEARFRFQWNSPIVISAHNPATIYYGGNFVFKSNNRGDAWTKISPDLTNNQERDKLPIMGKVPDGDTLSRHDGVQQWPTTTTLSESPVNKDVLWAGTDDGNLHVTRDGGTTWKNVAEKVPGVPKGTYVSRVIASKHAEGTAYVTFDGHRMDDFGIYVFASSDFGETWKAIRNGIPDNKGIVNVIREHHKNPDLLLAGTEYGAYISFDRGATWTRIKNGMPTVPVDDILIHPRENDLIFGTHGRSIWIMDNINSLEQMNAKVADSDLTLFDLRPAIMWRVAGRTTSASTGHKLFNGANPPNGAIIDYYLKNKIEGAPAQAAAAAGGGPGGGGGGGRGQAAATAAAAQQRPSPVQLAIIDSTGKTIRTINGTGNAGINRVTWDYRMTSPIPPAAPGTGAGGPGGGGGGGGFGGGAGGIGPRVDPGTYTVKITAGGKEATRTLVVEEDPRLEISAADRAARRAAINEVSGVIGPMVLTQRGLQSLRTALNTAVEGWKRPGGARTLGTQSESVVKAGEDFMKRIDEVYPAFANIPQAAGALGSAGPPLVFQRAAPLQRLQQVLGAMEQFTAAPTAAQLQTIKTLTAMIQEAMPKARKLLMEDLPAFNKLMNDAGVPHINVAGLGGGGRGQGRPPEEQPEP